MAARCDSVCDATFYQVMHAIAHTETFTASVCQAMPFIPGFSQVHGASDHSTVHAH